MNYLPEKKYGVPSHNFVKKNVLCEKGDEITRFDGRKLVPQVIVSGTGSNLSEREYPMLEF
jgi:hypothetical protein